MNESGFFSSKSGRGFLKESTEVYLAERQSMKESSERVFLSKRGDINSEGSFAHVF